jgi:hypothetical protein
VVARLESEKARVEAVVGETMEMTKKTIENTVEMTKKTVEWTTGLVQGQGQGQAGGIDEEWEEGMTRTAGGGSVEQSLDFTDSLDSDLGDSEQERWGQSQSEQDSELAGDIDEEGWEGLDDTTVVGLGRLNQVDP